MTDSEEKNMGDVTRPKRVVSGPSKDNNLASPSHSEEKLLPCPFCGGVELFRTADNINSTDRINCKGCNANAVLWKWNKRFTPDVTPSQVEAVARAIEETKPSIITNAEGELVPNFTGMAKNAISAYLQSLRGK